MAEIVITRTGNSVNIKDVSAPASHSKLDFTATAGTFYTVLSSDAQAPTTDDTIVIYHKRKGIVGSFAATEFTTPSGADVETIRPLVDALIVSPASSAVATSKTYAEWEALRSTGDLGDYIGQNIIVSDRGDTGLILAVASANAFGLAGIGGFLNPDWQGAGDYSGTPTAFTANQGLWTVALEATLVDGDVVVWNNIHWQVEDFSALAGTSPDTTPLAFTELPGSAANVGYMEEWDAIEFDWANDHIQRRADVRGNDFRMDFASLTEYAYTETISEFQWGRSTTSGNTINSGLCITMNFGGQFIGNAIHPKGEVFGLSGESASQFSHNTVMQRASMSNITLGDGSAVGSCIMETASTMDTMDLSAADCAIGLVRILGGAELSNKTIDTGVSITSCIIGNPMSEPETISASIDGKRTEAGFSNFEATIDIGTNMVLTYDTLANGPFQVGEPISADNGATGNVLADDGVGTMTIERTGATDWYSAANISGGNSTATANILTAYAALVIPPEASHCGILNITSTNPAEEVLLIEGAPTLFDFEIHPESGLILTLAFTPYATALSGSITLPAATLALDGTTGDWAKFRNDETRNNHIDTVQNL